MSTRSGTARPSESPPRGRAIRVLPWVVLAGAALLLGWVLWPTGGASGHSAAPGVEREEPPELEAARRALATGDFERAERIAADPVEFADRGNAELLLVAGEAATKRGRLEEALGYYDRVADDGSDAGVTALLAAGEILRHQGELSAAIAKFEAAVRRWPEHVLPNNRLALLLGVAGRRFDSVPYLLQLLKLEAFDVKLLCMLGQIDATVELPPEFRREDPRAADDPLLPLGAAIAKLEENDLSGARKLLERALALDADLVEAHARMGRVLTQAGSSVEFDHWRESLPTAAWEHPGVWHVLGLESLRRDRKEQAARCFWEAARRAPELQPANYQLGSVLKSLGRAEEAAEYLERAGLQQELAAAIGVLYKVPDRQEELRRAAEATSQLGRCWESRAWCQVALSFDPSAEWAKALWESNQARIVPDLPQTDPQALPSLDLSSYPLPTRESSPGGNSPSSAGGSRIAFADEARRLGIDFTFFKGTPAEQPSTHMHEFTGGGVGVLDYDTDGRPDLFYTQGRVFPRDIPVGEVAPTDRLFRNRGDRFEEVTEASGTVETAAAFGQGVACGDFDGDGLADVYVGNIGRNRLLRNNGDGTFADVSDSAGLPDVPITEAWTTSVLMADLTGDGLPDLFDVNYVASKDVYELTCPDSSGRPRACDPNVFPACPDRFLVNHGDGSFADRTAEAGATAADGNGLGVVAADFDESGRLSLFVANDQSNNHLFANVTTSSEAPRFEERGLITGLAVDRDGRPQACMGVAADDADGDGRLDLFITNFYLESNTLYRQLPTGDFEDATLAFGLRDPGYEMLGFGTQFLDADLDGRPDLVVTNGHVDDHRDRGIPYRMRPQVYRNLGGRFEELSAETLGPFFTGEYLGRGLAVLDWNGDGREDYAVSHIGAPAALLTNGSQAGDALGVRLVATKSARDAIGAVVTVEATNLRRVRQLTAGDGYQASNERRLGFGLADAATARITVKWPSGEIDSFPELATGAEWLLVEGRGAPLRLDELEPHGDVLTASRSLPHARSGLSP